MALQRTGVVRKMDALGRVVIPMTVRQTLGIQDGDGFEILIDPVSKSIVLKSFSVVCDFCGRPGVLARVGEKEICQECLQTVMSVASKKPADDGLDISE